MRRSLLFHDFKISLMDHLLIEHFQLNQMSWELVKAFQYCYEYEWGVSTLELFFHLFQTRNRMAIGDQVL